MSNLKSSIENMMIFSTTSISSEDVNMFDPNNLIDKTRNDL
jgi:hypothetical protein